jgi:putative transposase
MENDLLSNRGSEFNNHVIDEALDTFRISWSLSRKRNPYDNAVAESTFKILKQNSLIIVYLVL